MIDIFRFSSSVDGPHILMFGAIHGNEICGTKALQKLIHELNAESVRLKQGQLTIVPICNPEAYRQNVRQVEKNLNRVFAKSADPDCYEARLANELTPLVDQADILLDLHSFRAEGKPFVFLDYPSHQQHRDFSRILGIRAMVQGWADLFSEPDPGYRGDTVQYAITQGKNAVVLECGQHLDPQASHVGYQAARNTLAYFGLTDEPLPPLVEPDLVTATAVIRKEKPGHFVKNWRHLDFISSGELIAKAEDGTEFRAQQDMLILLPSPNAFPGAEWYYVGRLDK